MANQDFCPKGGVVLDPFMGTGSTGLAAIQEARKFVGIESNQHYVDVAQKRFDEMLSDAVAPTSAPPDRRAMMGRETRLPFQEFITKHIG